MKSLHGKAPTIGGTNICPNCGSLQHKDCSFVDHEWLLKVKHLLTGFRENLERNQDHSTTLNNIIDDMKDIK